MGKKCQLFFSLKNNYINKLIHVLEIDRKIENKSKYNLRGSVKLLSNTFNLKVIRKIKHLSEKQWHV